jgi:hypothetical protein
MSGVVHECYFLIDRDILPMVKIHDIFMKQNGTLFIYIDRDKANAVIRKLCLTVLFGLYTLEYGGFNP